ncbi:MAG: hypothetical protein V1742_12125 [Pseudomonadota bacterium]
MDVGHIAETYTQLGRLGRGLPVQPERKENVSPETNQDESEAHDEARIDSAPNRELTSLQAAAALNPGQAQALTEAVAEQIRHTTPSGLGPGLHDLTSVRFIPPRYV